MLREESLPGFGIRMTMDDFQIDGIRQDVTELLKSAVRYSTPLDPICFRWKMLSLSGPKARVFLQLLIPLVTCSVANVTAEVKDLGSKRHSLQAVELSQRTQAAVQIVSNLPAPSNGGPIYRFLGMAGAAAHKSG